MNDFEGTAHTATGLLRIWDDYVSASQVLLERLQKPGVDGAAIPLPIFGAWQQFAESMGITGDGQSKPDELMASLKPALGLTREYQIIVSRIADLGLQFQRRYAELSKRSATITEQALQAVHTRMAADPRIAGSPEMAYEVWIESAEIAYSQTAHSEEFAQLIGDLCNLLSALKVERGKLLEAFARQLDLPSRAEVDSLHRQVRELKSAVRETAATPAGRKSRARTPRKGAGK